MSFWKKIYHKTVGRWFFGKTIKELARRLDESAETLLRTYPRYHTFTIPKRSGGTREIQAPKPALKELQRKILRRLLARLRSHPNVTGFERRQSIVTNARTHVGADVIVRMDVKDFFPSTSAERVYQYFRNIGWNKKAANLLVNLCTLDGALPQGAPSSPRLSNLVNYQMDARLAGLAKKIGASYTRYADDITFSFYDDNHASVSLAIRYTKMILAEYGYRIHHKKKLHIRRRHQCQQVTGLVVNEKVALPRQTRRWLRAVKHHLTTGRPASLTPEQLTGWQALQYMIETQAK
jgi:RNA-directed DNA polymerase